MENKKFILNFCIKISWKTNTIKTEMEIEEQ